MEPRAQRSIATKLLQPREGAELRVNARVTGMSEAADVSRTLTIDQDGNTATVAAKMVVGADGAGSFVSMVVESLKSAVNAGRQAEELSLKQISGEADLKDVVTAVANAENTLETVIAVRDKVLSAYQEILRMPI